MRDAARPEPGPDQVPVEVRAASINPSVGRSAGLVRELLSRDLPSGEGLGLAGGRWTKTLQLRRDVSVALHASSGLSDCRLDAGWPTGNLHGATANGSSTPVSSAAASSNRF